MKTFMGTECFQDTTPEHLCLISLYQSKLSLLTQEIYVPNCHSLSILWDCFGILSASVSPHRTWCITPLN